MDWDAVDPLYAGRPEAFVAARNALAKALRAAGDKAAAAEVAQLRRPTPTAFALNQLARHQPELVDEALAARRALRAATEGAGRGEATELREATTVDRDTTRRVVAAAREVLGSDDPALAQRITATLLAAVLDPDVEATLRAGRLASELDASAFAFGSGSPDGDDDGDGPVAPVVSLAERAEARKAKRTRADAAAERDAAAAERAAAKAAEEADRARRRERVEREQAVGRLERRVARLEGKVAEIDAELAAARAELQDAERELAEERRALEAVADPD